VGPLPRTFYDRDTTVVARELLGKVIVRGRLRARIVETEAYHGFDDEASHAHGGPTPRSAIMFGEPGRAYVYQIYGMYFCLNAVTGAVGFPSAVLVRAGAVTANDDARAGAGPGKLCRALGIDKKQNGLDLTARGELWIGDDGAVAPETISAGPRVNVDYAGEWAKRPWRYWIDGHRAVSR
jgi:DNA-3-methyladenine glycosylase